MGKDEKDVAAAVATGADGGGGPGAGFRMPPLEGYPGSPEEVERRWHAEAYLPRGSWMRQLSFRSLFLGCFIGGIMAIPNIYMGMKSGVIMGLSLTCTLMAFMLWNGLLKVGLVRGRMTVLEYNAMASAASSASYTTVGGLVSSVAAFMLINQRQVPLHWLLLWTLGIALLGVTMAIPMKRRIINLEQLPFPGAIAAAEALELLCVEGSKGMRSGVALLWSGIFGMLCGLWNGAGELAGGLARWGHATAALVSERVFAWSPGEVSGRFSEWCLGERWLNRGVSFNFDLLFLVSGCFMGLRTTAVMFGAAVFCWMGWVPVLEWRGLVHTRTGLAPTYGDYIQYTLWFGAACLVVSGLLQVAFMGWDGWRKHVERKREARQGAGAQGGEMAAIEAPARWFWLGQVLAGAALVWIAWQAFGIPWWQTILAILLSFVLSIVTCRILGQTGLSVNSSMAKVTQLTFGTLNPVREGMSPAAKSAQLNINLMTAAITTGAACNAADLLADLKVGYYLGAHPRKQFLAQFAGIFAGAIASVLTFYALVPDTRVMEGERAPAVLVAGQPVFLPEREAGRVVTDAKENRILVLDEAAVAALGTPAGLAAGETVNVVLAEKVKPKFQAPAALAWKGVAQVVAAGLGSMEQGKKAGLISGALLGLALTVLGRVLPARFRAYVPPPGVVGLGFIFQWWMCLMMLLGAAASETWKRLRPANHGEFMVPVASGVFVGAPLVAAAITFAVNGQEIVASLRESIAAMFR